MPKTIYEEEEVILSTEDIEDLTTYQIKDAINTVFRRMDKKIEARITQKYPPVHEITIKDLICLQKELQRLHIVVEKEMVW